VRGRNVLLALLALLVAAGPVLAQTVPTGTIAGKATDQQGLAMPGVTVTVESPALQGTRTAITSANGDYIFPFLPPGDYSVTFTLTGFNTLKQTHRVSPGQTVTVNPSLNVSTVSETVTVTGTPTGDIGQGAQVATSFKQDLMNKLPVNRTLNAAVLLAPGVEGSGPNGNISINGAMSFESLYLINGVVVNENIRGQANDLFIEDALQETAITTAAVSAEYGRFQGGVVSALTKSGGNAVSGSARMTVDNDKWTALTPYSGDHPLPGQPPARTDKIVPTYEFTLGGPIKKDKLWFFGAARMRDFQRSLSTSFTTIGFINDRDQKRFEGKLTFSPTTNHTFKGAYTKVKDSEAGNSFGSILDLASTVNRKTPQDLLSANYTGIITSHFFVEAQYSRRRFTFVNSGSQFTDLIKGTLLLDQSRGNARYNSPTFCGVCDPEKRDNQNIIAKASYFLSTGSAGSHNIVGGVDVFDDKRFANNHQSGSDFRIFTTSAILQGSTIFPVMDQNTFIRWTPIFVGSEGNRFRILSFFLNDAWTFNKHLTLNLGVRYDKNDGENSVHVKTVKDSAFSPRLSATLDPKGDGKLQFNASYAQYVAAVANGVADSASPGGQPATIDFDYLGPTINLGNPANPVPLDQAINTVFTWFNANGGTNRATRGAPSIPGVNTKVGDGLKSPNSREVSLGFSVRLGQRGSMRLDGIHREFHDFYVTQVDLSTGRVADPNGKLFDVQVTENTDDLIRTYNGVNFQIGYRPSNRLGIGGNYTYGHLKGNIEGENGGSGPTQSGLLSYPEYFQRSWQVPEGDLSIDIRHKVRAWATWDIPVPAAIGTTTLGVLEFFNTGAPYGSAGTINTQPFVTNPGYVTPPASETYWFEPRDKYRLANLWRTDLALNWSRRLGVRNSELFLRGTILNVFNRLELTNFTYGGADGTCGTGGCINTTIQTNRQVTSLPRFNPFTETPVEGVNWRKAPNTAAAGLPSNGFGTPTSRFAYQTPRTYGFSFGVRF
jgi:Carboxypeptidase regulatory-like domain/TonB dependent receptor-like, beta-barrel